MCTPRGSVGSVTACRPMSWEHVREVGLARGDAGDERKGLGHVEMGIMLRKAERVDDEHLHAPEFFDLGIPDGLEIGQVGQPGRYGSP